jgi:hypothetical protein
MNAGFARAPQSAAGAKYLQQWFAGAMMDDSFDALGWEAMNMIGKGPEIGPTLEIIGGAASPIDANAGFREFGELFIEEHDGARAGYVRLDNVASEQQEVDAMLDRRIEDALGRSIWRFANRDPQVIGDFGESARRPFQVKVARVHKSKGRIHRSPSLVLSKIEWPARPGSLPKQGKRGHPSLPNRQGRIRQSVLALAAVDETS